MSFFDDEDDIDDEPTRVVLTGGGDPPRGGSGARPRSRSGGPPRRPADPAIERRRWVAGGVLVVVIILIVLLISSCQARNTKNALEDYNNSVSSLINRSDAVGRSVFSTLAHGGNGSSIAQSLATPLADARSQLSDAQGLSVPGQMASAQRNFVLSMQMRADGVSQIADAVSSVGGGSSSSSNQAVEQIALGTARFYASDVTYLDYAAKEITQALHGDNIAVGGNATAQVNSGQFLTSLQWLFPSFIADALGTSFTSGSGSGGGSGSSADASASCNTTVQSNCVHGDQLSSTAVGSNTLEAGVTNTVDGSPAPTFTLSATDGGTYDEFSVGCKVSVSPGGYSGTGTISELTPGNTGTCNVTLSNTVPPGTYTVTATIDKVPGETNLTNNSQTYPVQFQ